MTVTEAQHMIDGNFTIYQCEECGLAFVRPVPTNDELRQLYADDFYARPLLSSGIARKIIAFIFYPRRRRIERHARPGKILDFGCGDGRFAAYMAKYGWEVTGFDFSPTAQELAKGNPHITILTKEEEIDSLPSNSYDCITMWQVLEHIPDPVHLLKKMSRLMTDDGILVISVPNFASWQAKMAGDRWWGLDVPRHLVHFSPESLERTLQNAGLSAVSINHLLLQYAPYSFLHSTLDMFFTRRHFLSNLLKGTLPQNMKKSELAYNILLLIILTPLLVPCSLLETIISPASKRGAFIEVIAQKSAD